MDITKDTTMKHKSVIYLEMRGYAHEEAEAIVEGVYRNYNPEEAYSIIRSTY